MTNTVIPYNDKCNEEIYQYYLVAVDTMIKLDTRLPRHKVLIDIARNTLVYHLVNDNYYQQYYTLHQINHIAEQFADAVERGRKKLYIY